jgi:hypothetical protein
MQVPAFTFTTVNNQVTPTPFTVCGPGKYVFTEGWVDKDRVCKDCGTGWIVAKLHARIHRMTLKRNSLLCLNS